MGRRADSLMDAVDLLLIKMSHHIIFAALVNKGNVLFQKGDYEKAREFYREALNNDSSCVEALYNHGRCRN